MTLTLADLAAGQRLTGVIADGDVTVVAVEHHGPTSATLTFRSADGRLGERIMTGDDLASISSVTNLPWTFDADGAHFRLASEARRMKYAHLADPFAAVDTSNIEPYPHQIDAVYNRFLERRPLRFLLADDPGAGKTIMSGLLIRELMLRGDVARCLIVAPGSLVEQWQDELYEKFGLSFDLMSRGAVEASRSGNPFVEKNLLVARVDQLARADDMRGMLEVAEWDLVIVDEAHKMSAHQYGREVKKSKRFELGELLRERTRHFLLLTATPHNGKPEDFMLFMTLIDPERFGGRHQGSKVPDTSDVMRRLVKENLRTFEGKPLFPQRFAISRKFELSPPEDDLYASVTAYVKEGMNRADRMKDGGDKRRGLLVGFALAGLQRRLASSPAAIHESLRRRRDRLRAQAEQLRVLSAAGGSVPVADLPKGIKMADLEDFDFDDYADDELESIEDQLIDAATVSATAYELETELIELEFLVDKAATVRASGVDSKWVELRGLLRSDEVRRVEHRKLIVFTEHKDTLQYLVDRIGTELGRPDAVVAIHGGIKRHDRREIQDRFRVDPTVQVLVATDAAGEGVNLQVANLMVNYDLPWNPNRIEQRFGRIHRIGQDRPCHLWNLVAHETREGKVFERLFEKIEQQKQVYNDQVYDVLGDSVINTSLRQLLLDAIKADDGPEHERHMNEVIENEIGEQLIDVLNERALVAGLADPGANDKIRDLMERAKARKLQPWFVEAFTVAALKEYEGRIVDERNGSFRITRVPRKVRDHADHLLGPVHERYHRVTFDRRLIDLPGKPRAEMISPGTPLLNALVNTVLDDHGSALQRGAVLVDPTDAGTEPRLLVYLDHMVTDGRMVHGQRQVVSRKFQYVEIDAQGEAVDRGDEPYLDYAPLPETLRPALGDHIAAERWAGLEHQARSWAIEHLAQPHLAEIETITHERVAKVAALVRERLDAEIRYWDERTYAIKEEELKGRTPKINSGRARARADELEARRDRRLHDLDREGDLHNNPPAIVGAALIVPQGLIDLVSGAPPTLEPQADKAETDRRGVAAVMIAERALGRVPEEQHHSNPGFDILSTDPATGIVYFIEVKSHLPRTEEIHVSTAQVQKAKSNPDRWRLAIASVPDDPNGQPAVRYLSDPFRDVTLHFAQTSVPMRVALLLDRAGAPH